MSDANLLVFGCVVSFVAVAGIYVYLQERFDAAEAKSQADLRRAHTVKSELRDGVTSSV
jgi:hypothetical protein